MPTEAGTPATPVVEGAVAPAVIATPTGAPAAVSLTSEQLKARLDETRSSASAAATAKVLKELGLGDDLATAQKATKAFRDAEAAKLSESERANARIKELEPLEGKHKALLAVVEKQAAAGLAALNDVQRAAVQALAGDDPAAQLNAIVALAPTWVAAAPATAAAPIIPPATTTAPPSAAPRPGTPAANKFQEWQALEATPGKGVFSSLFYKLNRADIEAHRPVEG